jgi:hypothetical protein
MYSLGRGMREYASPKFQICWRSQARARNSTWPVTLVQPHHLPSETIQRRGENQKSRRYTAREPRTRTPRHPSRTRTRASTRSELRRGEALSTLRTESLTRLPSVA